MGNRQWHFSNGNQRLGPVPEDELKKMAADGSLSRGDLVWQDGMAEWKPAGDMIADAFIGPPPLPTPVTVDEKLPANTNIVGDNQDIEAIRYPGESTSLYIAWALLLLIVIVLIPVTLGLILVLLLITRLQLAIKISSLRASNPKVTAATFPELHAIAERCYNRLGIPAGSVPIYVVQSPVLGAYAMGLTSHFIVVHSAILEQLTPDEIAAVLGHEMGHVRAGHTLNLTLTSMTRGGGAGGIMGGLIRLVLMRWSRFGEYTCDRFGSIAAGSTDHMAMSLMKLSVGKKMLDELRGEGLEEFLHQASETEKTILGRLAVVEGTHPFLGSRVLRLREFADGDLCRDYCRAT